MFFVLGALSLLLLVTIGEYGPKARGRPAVQMWLIVAWILCYIYAVFTAGALAGLGYLFESTAQAPI